MNHDISNLEEKRQKMKLRSISKQEKNEKEQDNSKIKFDLMCNFN